MKKPKINKDHPGAFIDHGSGEVFIRVDCIKYLIEEDYKFFKKDFSRERKHWVADEFNEGEDIDIKAEQSITDMNISNVGRFCELVYTHIDDAENQINKGMEEKEDE